MWHPTSGRRSAWILLAAGVGFLEPSPASGQSIRTLSGFDEPGSIFHHGDRVYVTHSGHPDAQEISVLDISVYGFEHVSEIVTTPILRPIDAVTNGTELFTVNSASDRVWSRALSGGAWSDIPMGGTIGTFLYGRALHLHPSQPHLLVVRHSFHRVEVIDLVTRQVVHSLTGILFPLDVEFSADGSSLAVLQSTSDFGAPAAWVFDAATYQLKYTIPISEVSTYSAMATDGARLFIGGGNKIFTFDFATGAPIGPSVPLMQFRHLACNGSELVAMSMGGGHPIKTYPIGDLGTASAEYLVVKPPVQTSPPLEEIIALADGRIFVTNFDDDTVEIIDHGAPACAPFGIGCAGGAGSIPRFTALGCPYGGGTFTLRVDLAYGGSLALYFVGTQVGSTPLAGGCSVLVLPVLDPFFAAVIPGFGPSIGKLDLAVPVPFGIPQATFVLQAVLAPPLSPGKPATTNGLRVQSF